MRRITKIAIRQYRGIEALDIEVPEHGFTAKGANGRGKTTILRALRAALAAQDIGPDAIRIGADRAEILVNMGEYTVKRAITQKTSSLTVTKGDGEDSFKAAKPQTLLTELLGTSPLDPLDLFLSKPKERRAKVLEALPVKVTREELVKFAPDLPADFVTEGHGLEVVAAARKIFYDRRTEANRVVGEAERAEAAAAKTASEATAALGERKAIPLADAENALRAAEQDAVALEARAKEAAAAKERTETQRAQIDQLRNDAMNVAQGYPEEPESLDEISAQIADAVKEIERIEALLKTATAAADRLQDRRDEIAARNEQRANAFVRAGRLKDQASAIEAALEAATTAPPTDAERSAVATRISDATAALEAAKLYVAARAALDAHSAAKATLSAAESKASKLDATVKRLTDDAPAALLAGSDGIPGLTIDGDEVLLDGKRLDALCGNEQMKLAIEIARRANAKSKILVVDGLERIDPDQCDVFVREATRDGYQLIGTRVDRGDVVIEAIEIDEHAAAAE